MYTKTKKPLKHIPDMSTIFCYTESSITNSTVILLSWEKQFGKQEPVIILSGIAFFVTMHSLRHTNIECLK